MISLSMRWMKRRKNSYELDDEVSHAFALLLISAFNHVWRYAKMGRDVEGEKKSR